MTGRRATHDPESLLPPGLIASIRAALGADLVGLYLYGSAVAGGFDEGVSDVDLVAVTRPDAADLDLAALRSMHERFEDEHPDWRGRVEVAYVGIDSLRDFRTTTRSLAVVSPGESFHLRDDRLTDWAPNWYLVRDGGVALLGPPAAMVFPEVEQTEFVAAVLRYADEVARRDRSGADPGAVAYDVLTVARALLLVRTGTAGSKQEAAAWVGREVPDCAPILQEALATRRSLGRTGSDGPARGAAEECIANMHAAVHAVDS